MATPAKNIPLVDNAKDVEERELGKPKFLLVGPTGSGKTVQILTLPGKTFVYLFDPSALSTLKGYDIDYKLFIPEAGSMNLAAQSLSKGKSDVATKSISRPGDVYRAWENHYNLARSTNFFDSYENICFDSFTTFSDIVMDRILELNGRSGQFPQQDDYPGQMQTIRNAVRDIIALNKNLLFTAHDNLKEDTESGRLQNVVMLTGQLRVKLPLLFSDIWHMECKSDAKSFKYVAQTRPDRMNPSIRCTYRELDMFHDVTIQDWDRPKDFGIGKLLTTHTAGRQDRAERLKDNVIAQ